MITPTHYMVLSAALFMIGVIGVMVRRNIIIIFMSIELILNAVNINLVAYSWGRGHIRQADTIILTELEHHSNLVPWQLLAQEKDADLEFVAIDDQGRLDLREPPSREPTVVGLVSRCFRPRSARR